jgi:hypothetical protein
MKPNVYNGTESYIFVSYARADSDRVLPIIAKMQKQGFRIWFDQGIEAGSEWPQKIAQKLEDARGVIIFMSKAAAESKNCRREITLAVEKEIDPIVVYLEETELFENSDIIASITFDYVEKMLHSAYDERCYAMSVVNPIEKEEK